MQTKLNVANPHDREYTRARFVLHFGAYGWTHVLVYADHLEDALDEAVDWLEEHAPGLLVSREEERELLCEAAENHGLTMEQVEAAQAEGDYSVWDDATVDLTCAGNHGRYLASYEWGIVITNPNKAELIAHYHANS